MKVLVDTSVWSLALRRDRAAEDGFVLALRELIDEQRVIMIGPVRQELLSGIRSRDQFDSLRDHLRAFPDLPLTAADYEHAAACFNLCRSRGIQGSNTDFLLCAVAINHDLAILTTDLDFNRYAQYIPIRLHPIRQS